MSVFIYGIGMLETYFVDFGQREGFSLFEYSEIPERNTRRWSVSMCQITDHSCVLDFMLGKHWFSPVPVCFRTPHRVKLSPAPLYGKDPFRTTPPKPLPYGYEGYAWSPLLGHCYLGIDQIYIPDLTARRNGTEATIEAAVMPRGPGAPSCFRFGYRLAPELGLQGHQFFPHSFDAEFEPCD